VGGRAAGADAGGDAGADAGAVGAMTAGRERLVVGVDIGGTKTAILVCEAGAGVGGRALARHVAPTAIGSPDRAADAIASLVTATVESTGATLRDVDAVGVGVPGRVEIDRGEVSLAVNLGWHDLPLGRRLEARLGVPTYLENDVRAAALGLHRGHAFGGGESLAFLAIGTGISAGIVIDGSLHRGAQGLAGEIGHAIVAPGGPRCACGLDGCFEAVASGPAILARTLAAWAAAGIARPAKIHAEAGGLRTWPPLGAEDVFEAARTGDEIASGVIEDAGRAVAWAIHLLALTYDVDRIVIGGGVSHAGAGFIDPVQRELARFRAASPLAREVLAEDLVQVLAAGVDAGAWGAVTVAREASALAAQGTAVGHA
jgi:glucokinase